MRGIYRFYCRSKPHRQESDCKKEKRGGVSVRLHQPPETAKNKQPSIKRRRCDRRFPHLWWCADQNELDHHDCRLRLCSFTSGLAGNATALTLISRNYSLGRSSHCRSCTDRLRAHTWRYVYVYFKVFANVGSLIQVLPCVSHCVCVVFFVHVLVWVCCENYRLHLCDTVRLWRGAQEGAVQVCLSRLWLYWFIVPCTKITNNFSSPLRNSIGCLPIKE